MRALEGQVCSINGCSEQEECVLGGEFTVLHASSGSQSHWLGGE
jgi:hypothetical protein